MPLFQRCAALLSRSSFFARWRSLWLSLKKGFSALCAACLSVLLWLFIGLSVTLYVSGPDWIPTSTQWLILMITASSGLTVFWLLFWWLVRLMHRNQAAAMRLARQQHQFVALRQRLYREEFLLPDDPAEG